MGKKGGDMESKWLILRTSGRCTLPLAKSLAAAGYEVWTPALSIPTGTGREVPAPITPTFVFAKAGHLVDLIELSVAHLSPHDSFSVFHYFTRIPLIDDSELESLRSAEMRSAPKRNRKPYEAGEGVRVPEGVCAGMSGVVEDANGDFVAINFGGSLRWKIASWLLRPDSVGTDQPNVARAA